MKHLFKSLFFLDYCSLLRDHLALGTDKGWLADQGISAYISEDDDIPYRQFAGKAFVNHIVFQTGVTHQFTVPDGALFAPLRDHGNGKLLQLADLTQIVLAAVTFAVLPMAAGYVGAGVKMILCGTALFAALTWVFDSVAERVNVTCDCKCAMIPTAFVMYLACQCFMGMIL